MAHLRKKTQVKAAAEQKAKQAAMNRAEKMSHYVHKDDWKEFTHQLKIEKKILKQLVPAMKRRNQNKEYKYATVGDVPDTTMENIRKSIKKDLDSVTKTEDKDLIQNIMDNIPKNLKLANIKKFSTILMELLTIAESNEMSINIVDEETQREEAKKKARKEAGKSEKKTFFSIGQNQANYLINRLEQYAVGLCTDKKSTKKEVNMILGVKEATDKKSEEKEKHDKEKHDEEKKAVKDTIAAYWKSELGGKFNNSLLLLMAHAIEKEESSSSSGTNS